jgi:hypothetical protein
MQVFQARPRSVVPRLGTTRPVIPSLAFLPSLALGLALCTGISPADAQISQSANGIVVPSGSNPSSLIGPAPGLTPQNAIKPPQAPPDALPGAVSRGGAVPAQGGPIADPTEALFDAINRGDIGSARDAIDRGADLSGQSVLGLSPLDLSVDLGRNDITFLLLSLRNGDSGPGRRGPVQTTQTGPAAKPGAGHAATASKTPVAGQTKAAARNPATPTAKQAAQVAPAAPRLFAGDGGTPNPGAGFLGFDSRH